MGDLGGDSTEVYCPECGWTGNSSECVSDEDVYSRLISQLCPECDKYNVECKQLPKQPKRMLQKAFVFEDFTKLLSFIDYISGLPHSELTYDEDTCVVRFTIPEDQNKVFRHAFRAINNYI